MEMEPELRVTYKCLSVSERMRKIDKIRYFRVALVNRINESHYIIDES